MSKIVVLAIILKGLASVLDIGIKGIISKFAGVTIFGEYSFYINIIEMIFFCCFSGMMKFNVYYGAQNINICNFKKEYYIKYALPLTACIMICLCYCYGFIGVVLFFISICFLFYMDMSSWLLSKKYYFISQFGEYFIGRAVLFIGIGIILLSKITLNTKILINLYLLQSVLVVSFFAVMTKYVFKYKLERDAKINNLKLINFQLSDIFQSLITYTPMFVQYFALGAYNAGVLSIYLTFNKVITFISGPTSKVFLPRFSQSFADRDIKTICNEYSKIVALQSIYLSFSAVFCIFNLDLILNYFNISYEYIYIIKITCAVSIACTSLGPLGGLLQMIGAENKERTIKLISLMIFIIVVLIYRNNNNFIFYGLFSQILFETILKLICVIKCLGKLPFNIKQYCSVLIPISIVYCIDLVGDSGITFIVIEIFVLIFYTAFKFKENIRSYWRELLCVKLKV